MGRGGRLRLTSAVLPQPQRLPALAVAPSGCRIASAVQQQQQQQRLLDRKETELHPPRAPKQPSAAAPARIQKGQGQRAANKSGNRGPGASKKAKLNG